MNEYEIKQPFAISIHIEIITLHIKKMTQNMPGPRFLKEQ